MHYAQDFEARVGHHCKNTLCTMPLLLDLVRIYAQKLLTKDLQAHCSLLSPDIPFLHSARVMHHAQDFEARVDHCWKSAVSAAGAAQGDFQC